MTTSTNLMTQSRSPKLKIVSREAWSLLREAKDLLKDPATTEAARLRWLTKHTSFAARHKPAAQKYSADFHTRAAGIPCGVHIASYSPGYPGNWNEPPESPEVELFLLHQSGSRNHWLESKLTESEWEALEAQAFKHVAESQAEALAERRIEALIDTHNRQLPF